MAEALHKGDIQTQIATQPLINFHGGGNINHTLFWENLAPKNNGGGEPPSGALAKAIESHYGSLEGMKEKFNTALAGIQGSGWAWLVQDVQTGAVQIKTYAVCIIVTAWISLVQVLTIKIEPGPRRRTVPPSFGG